MKTLLVFFFVVIISVTVFAQDRCISVPAARALGMDPDSMKKVYLNAVNFDKTADQVFPGKEKEVGEHWSKLVQDLGEFLKSKHIIWQDDTKCFNMFFFNKEGKIDYYWYGLKDTLKEKDYDTAVEEFVKNYEFGMKADRKFSQCGGSLYKKTATKGVEFEK